MKKILKIFIPILGILLNFFVLQMIGIITNMVADIGGWDVLGAAILCLIAGIICYAVLIFQFGLYIFLFLLKIENKLPSFPIKIGINIFVWLCSYLILRIEIDNYILYSTIATIFCTSIFLLVLQIGYELFKYIKSKTANK